MQEMKKSEGHQGISARMKKVLRKPKFAIFASKNAESGGDIVKSNGVLPS